MDFLPGLGVLCVPVLLRFPDEKGFPESVSS